MKLFSLCSSLLLAGVLLFLTSAKPITEKKWDKSPSWYPAITVKNNSSSKIAIKLNYGLSNGPSEVIAPNTSFTFPNRGLLLLYSIKASGSVYIESPTQSVEYIDWTKGGGCSTGCSSFTINQTSRKEGGKTIFTFTVVKD